MKRVKIDISIKEEGGRETNANIEGDVSDAKSLLDSLFLKIEGKNEEVKTLEIPDLSQDLKRKEKFIKLLEWASKNHPKRGLTPSEFVDIFDAKFKHKPNVSDMASMLIHDLKGESRVTRNLEGKTYRWFIASD